MIVYDGLKSDFLHSVEGDTIALEIEQNILAKMGKHTVANEFLSWDNSMQYMYKVMNDPEIPADAGVAIEYNIPQTAKRVDFMVSGYDAGGNPGMVIVELKQWSKLEKVENTEALVETYTGGAVRKVVHPSYQAWSYAHLITDYNAAVQDRHVNLVPCAFLHNYIRQDDDPLDDEQYEAYTSEAPAFTKGQVGDLREFIKKCVKTGDKKEILYMVDHGAIRPSKSLQNAIASMIEGNEEFIMIDEQRVVYEEIIKLSTKCQKDHKKRTVICKGGPGTGKSVIAVWLLAELTQRGQFVQYVSKNSAPRQVYATKLKGKVKKSSVDNMFKGSGMYTEVGNNMIHTLLVDEAHRLNEKSGMFHNMGENQIKEIIHAAGCIHTTQGLEFDYVGVIIGDDIRYEDGHVVTDFTKRASTDQSIKGLKKMYREKPEEALERADEIIKNTYRTLMTRGMKGCYIYCTDPGMREYIRKRLAAVPKGGSFVHSM